MSDIIVTKRIHQLNQDCQNFIIVGVVIAKSEPKFFESSSGGRNNGQDSSRGVMTLTIRDSERDTINCTVWASRSTIESQGDRFHVGDVVNITKPKLLSSSYDRSEQFNPTSSSPFSLSLAEQEGCGIRLHEGSGLEQMRRLVHVAPVLAVDTYPLADIASGGQSVSGQSVNVLVMVRSVRPRKDIVIAKTGTHKCLREVIVMDASHSGMSMKFWNSEYIERIDRWIPLTTVLLVTDARIEYNQYFKSICLGMSSKTIVTEDPAIEEADRLLVHALRAPLRGSDASFSSTTDVADPSTITSVMSVRQILDRAEGDLKNEEDHFTALCYAVITRFDLDGCTRVVGRRCLNCRRLLQVSEDCCLQEQCVLNGASVVTFFTIPLAITDHTGTLPDCRLASQAAEATLNCKVDKFLRLSDTQKGKLKWRYLLERCAVKLMIKRKSPVRFQTMYSVVECVVANPQDVEAKVKVY